MGVTAQNCIIWDVTITISVNKVLSQFNNDSNE